MSDSDRSEVSNKRDPLDIPNERPPYAEDKSGGGHPEQQPHIGTDPMEEPQAGKHKTIIAPDPAAVRRAESARDADRPDEHRVRDAD
jgi:hypothetical protein